MQKTISQFFKSHIFASFIQKAKNKEMKKISMLFMAMLLFIAFAHAQNYFGAKGGIVLSSMTGGHLGTDYEDLGEIGGTFGAVYEYTLNDFVSFNPELIFSRKGTEFHKKASNTVIETRTDIYHFGYIEIPLLFKVKYDLDFMEVYAKIGPYFGLIAGGSATEYGYAIIGTRELKLVDFFAEREQDFSKFDMGLALSPGVAFYLGPGKAFLNFRYDIGFLEVASDRTTAPYDYKTMGANRAFIIETGYLFEF